MKIALASKPFLNGDTARNLQTMLDAIREAASSGAVLVCFGEAFLQGFDALQWTWEQDQHMAVDQHSSEILRLRQASRQHGIDVCFGYIERDGEELYSSCMLIEQGEITQNYRRISRGWKEYTRTDHHYREGDPPALFTYRGRRMTIALCGDMWDNREAFILGADILLWPVYCDYSLYDWANGVTTDYARQCCGVAPITLMINSICPPDGFGGCWHFVSGDLRAQLAPGSDGLLFVEV